MANLLAVGINFSGLVLRESPHLDCEVGNLEFFKFLIISSYSLDNLDNLRASSQNQSLSLVNLSIFS